MALVNRFPFTDIGNVVAARGAFLRRVLRVKAAICNADASVTIEADVERVAISVNRVPLSPVDACEAELLYHIILSHPNVLSYDAIKEKILEKHGIHHDDNKWVLR